MKNGIIRSIAIMLAIIFCATAFTACSASTKGASDYYDMTETAAAYTESVSKSEYEYARDEGYSISSTGSADTGSGSLYEPADSRKLIRNANMTIQTEHYDDSVQAVYAAIEAAGGYIESSYTYGSSEYSGRSMNITIRVPADRLDSFMEAGEGFGVIRSSNVWQEDVTYSYVDMETRLETLYTKKERLLALLEQATEMADIIELESALSDTIYEIESYTSSLTKLDNRISYSTVTVNLQEVYKAEPVQTVPETLGERISQRLETTMSDLGEFGEDFLVFLIGGAPIWAGLAILAVVIIIICKIASKSHRRPRRKAEHQDTEPKE